MIVKSIKLDKFRNYGQRQFEFDGGVNIICGRNAQGKTNLLESIYLLSTARSFRCVQKKEMIGFEHELCTVEGNVCARDRDFTIRAELFRDKAARFSVNGVKCKKNYEVCSVFNSVLFRPDDLALIKGGAAERRRFTDVALCQLRPSYAEALSKYNKYLESKQKILRDCQNNSSMYDAVDSFSEGMVRYGAAIIKRRAEFCEWLQREAAAIHAEISDGNEILGIEYRTVGTIEDPSAQLCEIERQLGDRMQQLKNAEKAAGQCLCGPHRDELEITINSAAARSYASQGQTRTAALSLKMAERQIFLDDSGEYPVLMLDDVLSELDRKRQDFVLNRIKGGQVFITCCEEERVEQVINGKTIFIGSQS